MDRDVIDRLKDAAHPATRSGWRGCPLVNPLCPDDLCTLPKGHGPKHRLGTMAEATEVNMPPLPDLGFEWTEAQVVEMGYWLRSTLWDDQW